jgi:hypothetical protein
MRCLRAFVLWLFEDGRLEANPFARRHRDPDLSEVLGALAIAETRPESSHSR